MQLRLPSRYQCKRANSGGAWHRWGQSVIKPCRFFIVRDTSSSEIADALSFALYLRKAWHCVLGIRAPRLRDSRRSRCIFSELDLAHCERHEYACYGNPPLGHCLQSFIPSSSGNRRTCECATFLASNADMGKTPLPKHWLRSSGLKWRLDCCSSEAP